MEINLIDDWCIALIKHFLKMFDSIIAYTHTFCPDSLLYFDESLPTLSAYWCATVRTVDEYQVDVFQSASSKILLKRSERAIISIIGSESRGVKIICSPYGRIRAQIALDHGSYFPFVSIQLRRVNQSISRLLWAISPCRVDTSNVHVTACVVSLWEALYRTESELRDRISIWELTAVNSLVPQPTRRAKKLP